MFDLYRSSVDLLLNAAAEPDPYARTVQQGLAANLTNMAPRPAQPMNIINAQTANTTNPPISGAPTPMPNIQPGDTYAMDYAYKTNPTYRNAIDQVRRLQKGAGAAMTAGGGSAPGMGAPQDAEWTAIQKQLGL